MRKFLVALLLAGCAHSGPRPGLQPADVTAISLLSEAYAKQDREARAETEWQLAQAFERAGLLNLASMNLMPIVMDRAHRHRVEAVQAMLRLHERGHDDLMIPVLLNQLGDFPGLTEQETARLSFLRARLAYRAGRVEEAVALCAQVPPSSPLFERAGYLRAVALSDLRFPAGARTSEAISVLEPLAAQRRDEQIAGQAKLALGRLTYGAQRWRDAQRWYAEAAKVESLRAVALVEQGWASVQLGEWSAAVANARNDEVRGSAHREAVPLEAVALFYAGRFDEAEAALGQPLAPGVEHNWRHHGDGELALEALTTGRGIPAAALGQLERNTRLTRLRAALASFDAELDAVNGVSPWKQSGLHAELVRLLNVQRRPVKLTLENAALAELRELQTMQGFERDVVELIGVEVALARRDLPLAIQRLEALAAKMPSTPAGSDLWFRVAAVQQAKSEVLTGAAAEEARAAAAAAIKRVLDGDPTYERLEEARAFLP